MVFSSIEAVLNNVEGHDGWKKAFHTRYLDFGRSALDTSH